LSSEERWLYENDVVDFVIRYLEVNGFRILSSSDTYSHGYDIVAEKDGKTLYIEAKGQTSSKPGTSRYGKEFNRNQKIDHVSKAIYSALKTKNQLMRSQVGIALPADEVHIELIEAVIPSLKQIGIQVFLVAENGKVVMR